MNVYRLTHWTHEEPDLRVGYKAPKGECVVMVAIGGIGKSEPLTKEWIENALDKMGLQLVNGEIWSSKEVE